LTAVGGHERAFEVLAHGGLTAAASKGHLGVALQPNVGAAQRRLILGDRFTVNDVIVVRIDVGV
jgi:hypothetical protein